MSKRFKIQEGKLVRANPYCPRCGTGVLMADKGEWWSCGKCGDRYGKKAFGYRSIKREHWQRGLSSPDPH